jgi:hypothetical protein
MVTLSLQNSINFVMPILKNQPLLVSINEPALTAANLVLGTILSPPFKWAFNRGTTSVAIDAAHGTDYPLTIVDFGFLDTQWLTDQNGKVFELKGATSHAKEAGIGRPTSVAPQYDDDAGTITLRFNSMPDGPYSAYFDYQKAIALMNSAASLWGVVPDRFMYVYNQGFLAMMSLLVNDARFPIFNQLFISRLLGAQDGLSDQEREIFIGNWMNLVQTTTRATAAAGAQGRGR